MTTPTLNILQGDRSVRRVAILCAARKSVYKEIEGCEVFDIDRGARTFTGGMPVVAHPPCRLWSAYCAHQAKSPDPEAEKALGLWCVEQVRANGGVLEQPAHSRLWCAAGIPMPNWASRGDNWSMEVPQFWFGDTREKRTWLYFVGINPLDLPEMPLRLKSESNDDRRIWQLMSSKNQRERTPRLFAEWLVACARQADIAARRLSQEVLDFNPKPTLATPTTPLLPLGANDAPASTRSSA